MKEFSQSSPSSSFYFLEKEHMAEPGAATLDPDKEVSCWREQEACISEDRRAARPTLNFQETYALLRLLLLSVSAQQQNTMS